MSGYPCGCCGPVCQDCEGKDSVVITFAGTMETPPNSDCGCWDAVGNPCETYSGSSYELPLVEYNPYVGFGSSSASCYYALDSPECEYHRFEVIIFTNYANGSYYSTSIRAGIQLIPVTSGCSDMFPQPDAEYFGEFDCNAERGPYDLPESLSFPPYLCLNTGATITIEAVI